MPRTRRKKKAEKTTRHVIVCALVVETQEEEDIRKATMSGVIPNLVTAIDNEFVDQEVRNGDGSLLYAVRDVTMFTEMDFMLECRKHGHPRRFPDVWVDGPPAVVTRNGMA